MSLAFNINGQFSLTKPTLQQTPETICKTSEIIFKKKLEASS
jgi:hypothetical protein